MENEATDAKCSIKSGKIVFGLNLEEKKTCQTTLIACSHCRHGQDKTVLCCVNTTNLPLVG